MAHSKLRIIDNNNVTRYEWLRHGREGNVQTLREMASLTRHAAIEDLTLQRLVVDVLDRAKVVSSVFGRDLKEIEAIFQFVQKSIAYRRDAAGGTEAIQGAAVTLQNKFGDCDDISVLLSTLLAVGGFISRFVVIRQSSPERRTDPDRQSFEHVFVEVLAPDGTFLALDACNKTAPMGWQASYKTRAVFRIFGDDRTDELEGFKDFFKKVGQIALKVAPVAAFLIPIPGVNVATAALIQGAIAGGSKLADQALAAKKASDAQKKAQAEYDAAVAKQIAEAKAAEVVRVAEAARLAAVAQQRSPAVASIISALPAGLQDQPPLMLAALGLGGLLLISQILD